MREKRLCQFVSKLEKASDEILVNTRLRCVCGWEGQVKDAPHFVNGMRRCPGCGSSSGWEVCGFFSGFEGVGQ